MASLDLGGRSAIARGDEHSQSAVIPWVQHSEHEFERTVAITDLRELTIRIGETFQFAQAAKAFLISQTNHSAGKILPAI